MGAKPLVTPPEGFTDPVQIASLELEKGLLPFIIERSTPDGKVDRFPLVKQSEAAEKT